VLLRQVDLSLRVAKAHQPEAFFPQNLSFCFFFFWKTLMSQKFQCDLGAQKWVSSAVFATSSPVKQGRRNEDFSLRQFDVEFNLCTNH